MTKTKPYILTASLSLLTLWTAFKIFNIDPTLPLNFDGDAVVHYNFAKNIEDTGWWFSNQNFGAPTQQSLLDFPLTENIQLLIIKLFIALGLNWYQSVNAFFILSFPLIACATLYCLQKIGVKTSIALPLSIIYTFIPYHFLRGVNHLFLANYFVVPFSVYVAYAIASNERLTLLKTLVAAILIASSGAYYTFLSVFLILVGFLIAFLKYPNVKPAIKFVKLIALITFFFFLNYLPTFVYFQKYGVNYNATARSARETETFGLKISQLLLPFEDHNLKLFNKIQKRYSGFGSLVTNENQYAALGVTAGFGFIFLLFWSLFRFNPFKIKSELATKLDILGTFNLAAVLFGTIGGFATVFSTYFNPTFRSVNRVSIYIAFVSLIAVGLILQRIKSHKIAVFIAWVVLVFALYDQISLGVMQNFMKNSSEYKSLVSFTKELENRAGDNAKIFTLPFGQYPEGTDKKLMRVALFTKDIKWSIGAEKWRASNYWQHRVYKLETQSFLNAVVKEGFTGLLIDTKDIDSTKLTEIENLLATTPLQGGQKKYSFYDLRDYAALNKINLEPTEVFYYVSGNCLYDQISRFYCAKSARFEFENISARVLTKSLHLKLDLPGDNQEIVDINVQVPVGKSDYLLTKDTYNKVFPIPSAIPVWPLNLGYPNFVISEIELR